MVECCLEHKKLEATERATLASKRDALASAVSALAATVGPCAPMLMKAWLVSAAVGMRLGDEPRGADVDFGFDSFEALTKAFDDNNALKSLEYDVQQGKKTVKKKKPKEMLEADVAKVNKPLQELFLLQKAMRLGGNFDDTAREDSAWKKKPAGCCAGKDPEFDELVAQTSARLRQLSTACQAVQEAAQALAAAESQCAAYLYKTLPLIVSRLKDGDAGQLAEAGVKAMKVTIPGPERVRGLKEIEDDKIKLKEQQIEDRKAGKKERTELTVDPYYVRTIAEGNVGLKKAVTIEKRAIAAISVTLDAFGTPLLKEVEAIVDRYELPVPEGEPPKPLRGSAELEEALKKRLEKPFVVDEDPLETALAWLAMERPLLPPREDASHAASTDSVALASDLAGRLKAGSTYVSELIGGRRYDIDAPGYMDAYAGKWNSLGDLEVKRENSTGDLISDLVKRMKKPRAFGVVIDDLMRSFRAAEEMLGEGVAVLKTEDDAVELTCEQSIALLLQAVAASEQEYAGYQHAERERYGIKPPTVPPEAMMWRNFVMITAGEEPKKPASDEGEPVVHITEDLFESFCEAVGEDVVAFADPEDETLFKVAFDANSSKGHVHWNNVLVAEIAGDLIMEHGAEETMDEAKFHAAFANEESGLKEALQGAWESAGAPGELTFDDHSSLNFEQYMTFREEVVDKWKEKLEEHHANNEGADDEAADAEAEGEAEEAEAEEAGDEEGGGESKGKKGEEDDEEEDEEAVELEAPPALTEFWYPAGEGMKEVAEHYLNQYWLQGADLTGEGNDKWERNLVVEKQGHQEQEGNVITETVLINPVLTFDPNPSYLQWFTQEQIEDDTSKSEKDQPDSTAQWLKQRTVMHESGVPYVKTVKVFTISEGVRRLDKYEEKVKKDGWPAAATEKFFLVDLSRPVLRSFTARKWIWVPQYHRRLFYAERAEHFHPMFKQKRPKDAIDKAADQGAFAAALDFLSSSDDYRPGGFTCGICHRKQAPTLIKQVNFGDVSAVKPGKPPPLKSLATGDPIVFGFKCFAEMANGKIPQIELRVANLCQGYFCHHREFSKTAMHERQRCFAVCMRCSQENALSDCDADETFKKQFGKGPTGNKIVPRGQDSQALEGLDADEQNALKIEQIMLVGTLPAMLARQLYVDVALANIITIKLSKIDLEKKENMVMLTELDPSKNERLTSVTAARKAYTKTSMFSSTAKFVGGPKKYEAAAMKLLEEFCKKEHALPEAEKPAASKLKVVPVDKKGKPDAKKLKEIFAEFIGEQKLPKADQTLITLRGFAIQLASFLYGGGSMAWYKDSEELQKKQIASKLAAAHLPAGDDAKGQSQEMLDKALNVATTSPSIDPLQVEGVPPLVRDVINTLYPSFLDEVVFRLIGVEEIDRLFEEVQEPIEYMSGLLSDMQRMRIEMLEACTPLLVPDKKGKMPPSPVTPSEALETVQAALRHANESPPPVPPPPNEPPTWAPSRLRPASTENKKANGQAAASYVELSFYRYQVRLRPLTPEAPT